ncbi:unnamed protein product [Phytomonas sp. EM1]|nr:unnamed protein product [Phytomonas sp. EM1]|eukprot:CCW60820.1 unnamed protein product [Phytomonas sp. isolate EM1]
MLVNSPDNRSQGAFTSISNGSQVLPPSTQQASTDDENILTNICFNMCRKESYHPNKGFKQLVRKLKQNATVEVNKEDITLDRLLPHDIVVFAAPQQICSAEDLTVIREYVEKGGSACMMFGDGHGGRYSYLNQLLMDWTGIRLNDDCVVRTVQHKYLHPKEVCVTNGVINRALNKAAGKNVHGVSGGYSSGFGTNSGSFGPTKANGTASLGFGRGTFTTLSRTTITSKTDVGHNMQNMAAQMSQADDNVTQIAADTLTSLIFVYPYGLTFKVNRPGVPILSSGFMSYPLNQPIAAVWECPHVVEHLGRHKQGKLLLIGSAQVFEDSWLDKEENDVLAAVLFDYLNHRIRLNQIDADEPDITEYHHLPDTASLSDRLRVAVEQQEELPRDFTKLFDLNTFKLDTDKIPNVVETYEKLNLKLEPLSLIPPEFQTPLPPVKPAVFDPIHRDPMIPALDLFDLDEEFAPERVQLAQLTNKCKPEGLSYYILSAAEILGVTKKLRSPRNRDPRALLDYVFRQVVEYKKTNAHMFRKDSASEVVSAAVDSASHVVTMDSAKDSPDASGVMRVIRVECDSNKKSSCDPTPFVENPHWMLLLEANFASGTISGTIKLFEDSPRLIAQEARVTGVINTSGNQEYPMEWGIALESPEGEVIFFTFYAKIQGNQLRGECGRGNGSTRNQQNFVYNIDDL